MESKIYKNKFLTMLVLMIALSLGMVKNVGGQVTAATPASNLTKWTTTTNNATFTVPEGVTQLCLEAWGGGGGGGRSTDRGRACGGGGGGAYAKSIIDVTPGDILTIEIGQGGSGGSGANAGGITSVSRGQTALVKAAGGAGVGNNSSAGASGGKVAECLYTVIAFNGGDGGNGYGSSGGGAAAGGGGGGAGSTDDGKNGIAGNNSNDGGAGGGATADNGGAGGNGTGSAGQGGNGRNYGGGGGGGKRAAGIGQEQNGGTGANGFVRISFPTPPTIAISGPSVICEGTSATLTATSPHTVRSANGWEWIRNETETGRYTDANTYLTSTYPGFEGEDYAVGTYTYKVRAHYNDITWNGTLYSWIYDDSESVSFTVIPKPKITNTNLTQTVCNGSTATITLTSSSLYGDITSLDNVTYEWVNNNPNIISLNNGEGTTLLSFTVNNPGTTEVSATITVTPSRTESGITCTGDPVIFTITVPGIPTIEELIAPEPFCAGKTINELITPIVTWNGPAGTTGWRWENYKEGDPDFSGDTRLGVDHNGARIYYYAKSTCGDVAESSIITLTIHGNQTISPPVMRAACTGSALSDFIQSDAVIDWGGGATGTAGWSRSNQVIEEVALTETFSSSTTLYYYAKSSCGTVFSAPALITIDPLTVAGTVSAAQTICSGSTPVALTLSGNTGNVVKWQWSTDGFVSDINDIPNTSTTLTPTEINNTATRSYRAVVKSGACDEAYTEAVLITVNPIPDVEVELNSNNVVCSGDLVSFAVTPVNGANSLAYTLKANGTELEPGILVPTEGQEPPYTVTARPTVTEETVYTIKFTEVKNTVTGCVNINPTQYGGSITVNPIPVAPSITMNPVNGIICGTGTVTLTATAVADATYTWYLGTTEIENETGNTLTVDAAGSYTVTVTLNDCTSAVSEPADVIVNDIPETPEITMNPVNGIICETGTVTLTATAVADATYTWYLEDEEVEGETGNTLTVDETEAGSYTVTVTLNNCTSAVSEPAEVIVNPLPNVSVVLSGDDNEVCSGDLITFTVTAINGADSLAYELSDGTSTIEGVLIPTSGQSSPYTVTARPTVTKRTVYTIEFTEVKNTVTGCVNTEPTQYEGSITVNPIPDVEVEITTADGTVIDETTLLCSGQEVTFTFDSETGANYIAYTLNDAPGELTLPSGETLPYGFSVTLPEAGDYTIAITEVKNTATNCINENPNYEKTFTILAQPTLTSDAPEELACGDWQEFSVTTKANCYEETMVRAKIVVSNETNDMAIADLVNIDYYETTGNQGYLPLPFNGNEGYFGPSAGFPFADATSKFRISNKNTATENTDIKTTVTIFAVGDASETPLVTEESTSTVLAKPTLTSDAPEELACGDWQEFGVTTEANCYAGTLVRAKIVVSNETNNTPIADLVELEYFENANDINAYLPLPFNGNEGYFGPSAGFPFADATSKFRISNKNTATENTDIKTTVTIFAANDPSETPLVTEESTSTVLAKPTLTSDAPEKLACGDWQEFGVTTEANCYAGTLVRAKIVVSNETNNTPIADLVELEYFENANDINAYLPLPFNGNEGYFGPSAGFPFADATSKFRISNKNTATENTDIKTTVTIFAANDPSETPLVTEESTSTVLAKPTLTSDAPEELACGDWQEFGVTTEANCYAGTLVRAKIVVSNETNDMAIADLVELEYFENANDINAYLPLPFNGNEGYFGPSAGFPFADATSKFRISNKNTATENTDIKTTVTIFAANDPSETPLVTEESTSTVLAKPTLSIAGTFPATINCGDPYLFGITSMANCYAGTNVKAKITFLDPSFANLVDVAYLETAVSPAVYMSLTFTNGVAYFGPDAGFPFTDDLTSSFRITNKNTATAETDIEATVTIFAVGAENAPLATLVLSSTVTPIPNVTVELTSEAEVCSGELVSFEVTPVNGANYLAYTLKANGTELEPGILVPTEGQEPPYTVTARPTVTEETVYTIKFTEVKNTVTGCVNAEPTQYEGSITVNPIPDVTVEITTADGTVIDGNTLLCSGQEVTFTFDSETGANYIAYTLNGVSGELTLPSGETLPYDLSVTLPEADDYTIAITEVKNAAGCVNENPDYEETFTVNPIPDVSVVIKDEDGNVIDETTSLCSGQEVTFTFDSETGANYIAYTLNGVSGELTLPSGETLPYDLSVTLPEADDYTIAITEVKNAAGCVNENPDYEETFTVNPIPEVSVVIKDEDGNVIDETTSLCSGQEVTFTFDSETGANYIAYTLNGVSGELTLPSGETLPYDLSVTLPEAGEYTIAITEVKNAAGCVNETPDYEETFTVNPIPDVSVVIKDEDGNVIDETTSLCSGQEVTFTFDSETGANYIAYTLNGVSGELTLPSGETLPYDLSVTLPEAGEYTIAITEVKNAAGCVNETPDYEETFTVNPIPDVTVALNGSNKVCSGELVSFEVTPVNGANSLAYTLYANGTELESGILVPTEGQEPPYTVTARPIVTVPTVYTIKFTEVKNTVTGCINAEPTQYEGSITVNPIPDVTVALNGSNEVCSGELVSFEVTPVNGANSLAYTLYANGTELESGTLEPTEGQEPPYTVTARPIVTVPTEYTIVFTEVKNTVTGCINTEPTQYEGSITVNPIPDVTVALNGNNEVCSGDQISFTVTAINGADSLAYTLKANGTELESGTLEPTEGQESPYTVTARPTVTVPTVYTIEFTEVKNTVTGCVNAEPTQYEGSITVNPIPAAPSITMAPEGGLICGEGSVTLTATAVEDAIYTWYLEGEEVEGKTGNTLTVDETEAGSYTVTVTLNGCTSAVSEPADVIVNDIPETPEITMNPVNGIICETGTVTLTATAVADATYTWYLGTTEIEGKTGNTLTVDEAGAGSYTVTVTLNGCTSAVSGAVAVIVNDIPETPEITMNPVNGIICETGTVTLTATAVADATYTWYLGTTEIEDKTGNTLTVDEAGAGSYTVTVTLNGCTSAVSGAVAVIVNDIPETPEITMNPVNGIICETGTVTLTVTAVAGATYTWYFGTTEIENETGNTLTVDAVGSYTVTVTLNNCTSAVSEPADVIVNDIPGTPEITMNPVNGIICGTGTVTLTATEVEDATYTWYLNGSVIDGAANVLAVDAAGSYTVAVTLNGCTSAVSGAVAVIVNDIPETPVITMDPATGIIYETGSITLTATGVTNGIYTWYWGNDVVAGETTNILVVDQDHPGIYKVSVTVDGCSSEKSESVEVILEIPDVTVCINGTTTLTVSEGCMIESNTGAINAATVDQINTTDFSTGDKEWTLGPAAGEHTNRLCGQLFGDGDESTALSLTGFNFGTLLPNVPENEIEITGISISFERKRNTGGATVPIIQDHSIGLLLNGAKLGNSDISGRGTNWPGTYATKTYGGATTTWGATLTKDAITNSTFGLYFVAEAKQNGLLCAQIAVRNFTMTVYYKTGGHWYTAESGGELVYTGNEVIFDADGGSFQSEWTSTATAGAKSLYLKCANSESRMKMSVLVNDIPETPEITMEPEDGLVCGEGSVALTTSEVAGATYTWYLDGSVIDGAATNVLEVDETGSYTVTVTLNDCTSEVSEPADVIVNPLPEGTIAGAVTTCAGTEEEYSLDTESTNLTYAWTVTGEGNSIDDAASAAPTVTWSISGILSVTFTDENGCEGEATLDVTVNPLPEGTIAGAVTTCAGTEEEYSLDTESTNLTYAWTITGEGNNIDDAASAAPTVTWSISGTLSVTFTDENGCEGEATLDVTVNPLPEGTIAGAVTTCAGTEEEYSLDTESTNLTYAWTVTGEGNNIDDATSAAPTVTWSISGTLSVTFTDENGCEGEATLDVTVNPLPEGTIAGEATTCAGTEEEYSLETESTNLTYAWTVTGEGNSIDDAASAAPTVTWSISGTLSVTFTDENGCEGEATLDVTVNPLPEGTIAGEATTCAGTEEEYSLDTESTNLTYAWTVTGEGNSIDDAASAAPTVTWSISGTLSVTFTDENGCEGEATLDVTVNPLPEGTIAGEATTCAGTEEEYSLETESTNLTYAWTVTGEGNSIDDAASAAPTVTWSISGTLSVTFTDENGCEGEATLDVTVNPLPEGTIAGEATTCADTEEEYSLETESTNLTYAWTVTGEGNSIDDAASAAPTVTWSISGTLSVTFTDENGCEGEATLDVTVNPLPEGTIAGEATTCAGTEEEYSLETESTNLTYAWTITGEGNNIDDAASAAPTVTWSISGTLSVTFTDENGCEGEATLDVTVNPLPEGTIAGAVTTCAGTEEEYSLDTESTNLTYAWTITGEGNNIDDATSAAPTVTWSISGTLSVTFTDENGCEGEATLDVTVNPLPEGTIAGAVTTCAGTEEEYSLDTESTNLTYAWTITGEGNNIDDATSAAPTVTWSISGTLSVTFTDENGCEGEATLDVTVNPLPEGTIAGAVTTCAGTEEEYSLDTESTNLTYAWTITGEGNNIDDATSAAPTVTWSISGTLSVTFTDENGCEGEATLDVTVNPLPEGTIAGAVTTCAGTEEEYSLDTESTNLTYAWTITGEGNNIDDATSAAPTVTWSISGTLSVTFTDENGCEGEATLDVTVNPLPEGTIAGAVTTCAGTEEEYSLDTESTNLTYAWTITGEGNNIDDATSAAPTVTWSISGTLSVTFTDENGCEGEATLDVTVNPLPEGTIAGAVTTCAGTEEEYSLETESTNLTYAWTVTGEGNNIDDATSAAPTVTWSISGILSVTFTDENGCEGEATLDVTVNPLPEGTIAGAVTTCAGTEEEYSLDTESTNLTYAWTITGEGNNIDDATSAAPTVTWSISGILSVTFTDENGCEGEATLDVTVNPLPEGTIAGAVTTCAGTEEEYSLDTESTNLTYAWTITGEGNNIDDATSAAPTVTWSISGILSVTFTDENGCEGEATLDVTVNPLPEGTIAGAVTTCAGTEEEYSLETESTNLTYAWTITGEGNNIDDATSAAPTVTWSISGTLSVTFTDENGCEGEATLDVTVNPLPEGTIAGAVTTCAGTEEEYSLDTESTNLTYAWTITGEGNNIDDATSAAPTVTWSISGTLSVTFTDENGCEGEATLDVTVNPLPEGTIAGAVTTCAGNEEEYSLETESTNLTYAWTITGEGNNIDDATSAAPTVTWSISGILSVTFTDENGCEGEATLDVTVNPLPETPEITMNPVNGIICETGTVTLTATEVADATYTWYLGTTEIEGKTGNTLTVDEAGAGSYTVTVTLNDCTSEVSEPADVIVNDIPATPSITMNPATGIIYGTGTVTLTATEVVNGIYTWYLGDNVVAGETTNILVVDQDHSGIYKVSVAVDGCSSEKSESVEVILEMSVCIDGTTTLTAPDGCVAENTTGTISPTAVAQTASTDFSRGDKAWTLGAAAGEHNIQLCESLSGGQESNALQLTGFNFDVLNNLSSDEVEITGISISFERWRNTGLLTVGTIQDHSIGLLLNGDKLGNPNTSGRGTNWPGTYATKTYGDATTTWGATLTKEVITNSAFGLYFVAEAKATGVGLVCAESAVRNFTMTVYYKTGGQWYTAESGGELVYTGNEVIFDADGGSTQSAWTSTATPGVKSLYLQCGDERTEMSVNVIDNQSVEWEATELLFADGDPEKINLTYEGFTPWSFTYSVNGGTDILVEDIEETTYSIDLSGYEIGDYVFELTNLNEGMCVTLPDPIALTIVDEVLPTDIEILNCPDRGILYVNNTYQMEAQISPHNVSNKTILWRSSNPNVAVVDANGLVTCRNVFGLTYIIAATADGSFADTCSIMVIIPPTSIVLNKSELTMSVSTTERLSATVFPINATHKEVTWESSDETIATVDQNGYVTAIALGNVTITATAVYGDNLYAECAVSVVESEIPATGIAITPKTLIIDEGETADLTVTLKPINATSSVTWTSNNPAVATVDSNGTVTAILGGKATITAQTSTGYKATCTVTVTVPIDEIIVTPGECTLPFRTAKVLKAAVYPTNATNKTITWSSSNTALATVTATGIVTAKSTNGVVEIYATNVASGKKGICVVTIGTGDPAVPIMSITEENELSNIELFPNPVTSVLTVKFNGNAVQDLEIYNLQGQRISSQSVKGKDQVELNVESLPTGIYFIRADQQTLKFVKR